MREDDLQGTFDLKDGAQFKLLATYHRGKGLRLSLKVSVEVLSCPILICRPLPFNASLSAANPLEQHATPRALYALKV